MTRPSVMTPPRTAQLLSVKHKKNGVNNIYKTHFLPLPQKWFNIQSRLVVSEIKLINGGFIPIVSS